MKKQLNETDRMQELAGINDQAKTIYTVIPFFNSSNEVEINQNDVVSFVSQDSAMQYAQSLRGNYEIVQNELK